MNMNFIEEESDSSVDGYDRTNNAQWITANKAKRNKAKYSKNGAGTSNKQGEREPERRDREEDGLSQGNRATGRYASKVNNAQFN